MFSKTLLHSSPWDQFHETDEQKKYIVPENIRAKRRISETSRKSLNWIQPK